MQRRNSILSMQIIGLRGQLLLQSADGRAEATTPTLKHITSMLIGCWAPLGEYPSYLRIQHTFPP